ncbi:putative halogenase [Guyanagaster necrorhizus]|uniref:Halogenase n=1 Tax=Guyanagaster necrorhizus TaxID=856835 RepID=A0A9P8AQQ5_9AGAR|nr:putative halogenase [Guyanagaster necrorhizus MCA 3950]KAG7444588.1 putative halogenase [Guyanagaster necrorhizus MCA 3950]
METQVPSSTNILVIGGGPAGSYAAAVLAREGFEVLLLEKDVFPRYHIGESMLPSCRPFLKFIGLEEKVKNYGFAPKPGAAVKLNQYKREGYTDFISTNPDNGAWNVVRSEFDELLLRHAAEMGVHVCEGVRVEKVRFAPDEPVRPVSLVWSSSRGGDATATRGGEVSFRWLVDASGRNGLMSTRYLKNRTFNESLRNVAVWGYWTGAECYAPGTTRENAPWFEALTDETGWAWFIPLHNGTTSVGVVLVEEESRRKKMQHRSKSNEKSPEEVQHDCYMADLQRAPGLIRLLGNARFEGKLRSAGDYSYHATEHAGPNYRIAGDAGAFIDPFFSSGIHLAFTGGLSAASTIAASIRGNCTEVEACGFHNAKVGTAYTRFLLVVLGVYKQIRSQETAVLYDVDEDNFDRAFHFLRPVIQGSADADEHLTEAELQSTLDFCRNVFAPTRPEAHEAAVRRLGSLADPDGPLLGTDTVDELTGTDMDAKHALWKINARKPLHSMYDCKRNFGTEIINGFYVRMVQGMLGLVRV